jgi:uncharacterized protein (TIGR03083 family)
MDAVGALDALRDECELISKTAGELTEEQFALPTRCAEWNLKGLLGHVYHGVHRITESLAADAPATTDADSVSYWRTYDPATDAQGVADRGKAAAARFATGKELVEAWNAMWRAAVDVAARTDPGRVVKTWRPCLRLDEYLKTRVLEVTVHRMDLDDALGRRGWGTDAAVSIVDDILSGLLGEDPPRDLDWDVVDFIEAGCGRRLLTGHEREVLGPLADRFPLLG